MAPPALPMLSRAAGRALGTVMALAWLALTLPSLRELPGDAAARWGSAALLIALAVALSLPRGARALERALLRPPAWLFLALSSLIAAGLSVYAIRAGLRGRVLAIDSAVYVYQARALGHFSLGMPVPHPSLPFGGRFLFEGADGRMHGVFPPGFPLYLAPFVRAGVPLAAGVVLAVLLVPAQHALTRVLFRDERAARTAVLLSLPSFTRAIETADLLSHALVAALVAVGLASAVHLARGGRARWGLACGAAVGWAVCARLLDGVVLGLAVGAVFALGRFTLKGELRTRGVLLAVLASLPFLALLAADQRAATGSALRPTQLEYFARSDFPPTCHRLGFGLDVGCMVEHPTERRSFGPDGYSADDAARIMTTRAGAVGRDLLGLAPLLLLALFAVAARPAPAALLCAGFTVLLCLAYGLFYYGNAPIYGARHLFPAAPCVWALGAWALARAPSRDAPGRALDAEHVRGAALVAALACGVAAQSRIWPADLAIARLLQSSGMDVRAYLARHHIERGIVVTNDQLGTLAAVDPYTDGERRFIVPRMGAYLRELRALHPELLIHAALPGDRDVVLSPAPLGPGLRVEIESAWPSFVRPHGLGAAARSAELCCRVQAGDGIVLQAFLAQPGASLTVPFDVARADTYALRVAGVAGPANGDWRATVDGVDIGELRGYAAVFVPVTTAASAPMRLGSGRHTLVLTSTGRDARSLGFGGTFDALLGEAASATDASHPKG